MSNLGGQQISKSINFNETENNLRSLNIPRSGSGRKNDRKQGPAHALAMSVSESCFGATIRISNMAKHPTTPIELILKLEKEVQKSIRRVKNMQFYN